MDPAKLARAALPASMAGYLRKASAGTGHHGGHPPATREVVHNGHRIVLETIYRVTVDGRPVDLDLTVDDAGQVHCHSLPNYQFGSALDMVKTIVDQFPDDFRRPKPRGATGRGHRATVKRATAPAVKRAAKPKARVKQGKQSPRGRAR